MIGIDYAKRVVTKYIRDHLDPSDPAATFEVYVVWYCYILGGWKALVSSTLPDGMYYEVTFNTANGELYLDAYKRFDHVKMEVKEEQV